MRLLPASSLVAISLLLIAGSLPAQETEEVVVTGSRIRQDPLLESAPVLTLDAEDIERSGLTSLGDYLQRLSVSGSPLTTRFNSSGNFGFPADGGGIGAGSSQVDLRHLGAKRVLVLVDGIRWVNGASGSGVSGATDLNTIPTSIIERIEVLEDGASAIYGSDAVAGVVNIITRKDFDGVDATGYVGGYDGGGETQEFTLSLGSAGDKTQTFVSLSYTNQDELSASKREQSRFPKPGTGNLHGSSFTPQGRVIFSDPNTSEFINCTLNDGVTGIPFYDPADPCGDSDDYHPWTNNDRFNFSPFNLVMTPSERFGIYGQAQHAITDDVQLYLKGLYNNRKSKNQAAPEPLSVGEFGETSSIMDQISIHETNPFNPFGFTLGPDGIWVTRRPLESGPRIFEQDVDTWYLGGGLQGQFEAADRAYYWDVNAVWSRNGAEQTKRNSHNARKLLQALGPVDDCVNDPINSVAFGAPCVPVNLLGGQAGGGGTLTPAMLDWFRFVQHDISEQELVDFTANISGDLVDLPAGPLGFAVGLEHREQDGEFQPDAVVAAGDTAGLPAQPTAGGYQVDEFYAEISVPLLAEVPGADLLDFSAAIRTFDYNTFGNDSAAKFGLRWRPTSDFALRGTWGEGFRAPNIGELFGGRTRFDATIADPCSDLLDSGASPTVIANCIAEGVPADGSYTQLGGQIGILTGGNPRLQPETSDSYTLGAVYSPDWVESVDWADRLDIELTYYSHEIDGAITGFDAQTVLDGCYGEGIDLFCSFINRNSRGGINRFLNTLFNIGTIETDGYDFNVVYTSPGYDFGQFQVEWYNTFLNEYTEILRDLSGNVIDRRQLEGRTENDRGKPEWKSTLIVDWLYNEFTVSWIVRHIDSLMERCSDFLDGSPDSLTALGVCSAPNLADESLSENRLASTTYHDLRGTWTPDSMGGNFNVSLGLNNLFDKDPPISQSASLNGYDASTYDIPGGQFIYLEVGYRR